MQENINLYKRIKSSVHVPNSLGARDFPLYKRVDINFDGDIADDNFRWALEAAKDTEWIGKIQHNYGSPRNIRRLFIGENKVVVHFWKPCIKNGKQETSRIKETTFSKKVSISEEMLKCGADEAIKISGNKAGLESLKVWSLKNLEEVYFDWTAIFKSSYVNLIMQTYTKENVIVPNSEIVRDIFINLCCRTGNLEKDYPRLKKIAYITKLDELLINYSTAYNGKGQDSIEQLVKDWLSELGSEFTNGRSILSFDAVSNSKLNNKFACSPNIYTYDGEILLDYFRGLAREIDKYNEKPVDKQVEAQEDKQQQDMEKKPFEIATDKVYDKAINPDKELKYLFELMVKANGLESLASDLQGITKEGRTKLAPSLKGIEKLIG